MLVRTAVLVAALALPGVVLGQGQIPPPNPPAPTGVQQGGQQDQQNSQGTSAGVQDMKALGVQHNEAIKEINAKENADIDAAKADGNLAPAQKAEKLAAIRKDYKAQRSKLNKKYVEDRWKIHSDLRKNRPVTHRSAQVVPPESGVTGSKR